MGAAHKKQAQARLFQCRTQSFCTKLEFYHHLVQKYNVGTASEEGLHAHKQKRQSSTSTLERVYLRTTCDHLITSQMTTNRFR